MISNNYSSSSWDYWFCLSIELWSKKLQLLLSSWPVGSSFMAAISPCCVYLSPHGKAGDGLGLPTIGQRLAIGSIDQIVRFVSFRQFCLFNRAVGSNISDYDRIF